MLYLDTSALTKLVLEDSESSELLGYLRQAGARVASTELARTELPRAVLRRNLSARGKIEQTLHSIDLLSISAELLVQAGYLQPPELRSLDAIHLASAFRIRAALDAVIAYDRRLLDAAAALGLPVASPGMD